MDLFLQYLRLILYLATAIPLIGMAVRFGVKNIVWYQVGLGLYFMLLEVAVVLRLLGYPTLRDRFADHVLTWVLLVVCILVWARIRKVLI